MLMQAPPPRVVDYFCVLSAPARDPRSGRRSRDQHRRRRRSVFAPGGDSSTESSGASSEEEEDDDDDEQEHISNAATITHRYPAEDHDDLEFPAEVLGLFCFPAANSCEVRVAAHPIFSSFVLTGSSGDRTYVSHLTYLAKVKGKRQYQAMCLISRLPMYSLHEAILIHVFRQLCIDKPANTLPEGERSVVGTMRHLPERLIRFLVQAVPVPRFKDVLSVGLDKHRVFYSFGNVQAEAVRAYRDPFTGKALPSTALPHVDDAVFGVLFRILSPDVVIKILSCMLQEQRILFHSAQTYHLTCVCEAMSALVYPLTWNHVFIPVLPHQLLHYVEAPMAYLIGIDSSSLLSDEWQAIAEACLPNIVVDLDNGSLTRNHVGAANIRSAGPPPPPPGFSRKQNSEIVREIYRLVPVSPAHGDSAHLHLQSKGRERAAANYRSPFSGHRFNFSMREEEEEEARQADGSDHKDDFHHHRPPSLSIDEEEDVFPTSALTNSVASNSQVDPKSKEHLYHHRLEHGLKATVLAGSPHNRWVDQVRVLFLRAVLSLLMNRSWDFRGHLQSQDEEGISFTQKAFDDDAFVSTVSGALRPLVRKLVNTQMFAQFAVALVDTKSEDRGSAGKFEAGSRGGEVRRARSATAKNMSDEKSDFGQGKKASEDDPLLGKDTTLPANIQGNFWHLLELVAENSLAPLRERPPPPRTPKGSIDLTGMGPTTPVMPQMMPTTPDLQSANIRPPAPRTPQGSIDFGEIKPSTPLTAMSNSDGPSRAQSPTTPPLEDGNSSVSGAPQAGLPHRAPSTQQQTNGSEIRKDSELPLPPPSGKAKRKAKNKLMRKRTIAKRANCPSITQLLSRPTKTHAGTPISNAYRNGYKNTNLSDHGVCILHVPNIPTVQLSADEKSTFVIHECVWGSYTLRDPVLSLYDVSVATDDDVLNDLSLLCRLANNKDRVLKQKSSKMPTASETPPSANSVKRKTKLSRRRHSTMAALGTNDLSYLGISEGRFAEIQKSIWTHVLPTTGRRCSFVAKRGRRGSMILAKGGMFSDNLSLGSSQRGGNKRKSKVGSLEALPEGDNEELQSMRGAGYRDSFNTPEIKPGFSNKRILIGGSGDTTITESKFGKTPKYGKTPGTSRNAGAAQNRPPRRLVLKPTSSMSKMTFSPSTSLHSPTAEDIQTGATGNLSSLSPSMNAIISARRFEIAARKYKELANERRELRLRIEEIENGLLLKSAVRLLIRRWRMKQSAKLQKGYLELTKKSEGVKPARC